MSTGTVDVSRSSHEIQQDEREVLSRIQSLPSPMQRSEGETFDLNEGRLHVNDKVILEQTNSNGPPRPDFAFNGTPTDVQLPQPIFESLVGTLRDSLQDQLREVLTYMRNLDESVQLQGRQTELNNNMVSLVEQLNNRLRNLQDNGFSGEVNAVSEREPLHERPKSSSTSILSPTSASELSEKVSTSPSDSSDSDTSGTPSLNHPASQSAAPNQQVNGIHAATSSTGAQSQSTAGSTTIVIGSGTNSKQDQPTVTIVIQNPVPAQQPPQQSVPLNIAPAPPNSWTQFPMLPTPPGAPNFFNPYPAVPPYPSLQNNWGLSQPPFVTPVPHVPPMPNGGWYATPIPQNIQQPTYAPYSVPPPGLPIVPGMDGRFFTSAYPPVIPPQVTMIPTQVVQPQPIVPIVERSRSRSRSRYREHSPSPSRVLPQRGRSPGPAPLYNDAPVPVVPPAAAPDSYPRAPSQSPPRPVPVEPTDYSTTDYKGYRAPLPSTSRAQEDPFPMSVSDPEPQWGPEAIQRQALLEADFAELKGMIQQLLEKKENSEQAREKGKEEERGPRLQNILRVDKSVIEFTKIIAVSVLILVVTDFIRVKLWQ